MDLPLDRDLQLQAHRWRLHVDQTPLAVIEWDLEGRVRSWNPAAERMFGYAAQEAIGQPIIDLIVPPKTEVREQVQHIAEGLTQTGQASRAEHENRRKDGSIILCRWFNTPLTDGAGQPLGVASMALDVTEIRRSTQALMESEQRFRTVFEMAIDGIILFSLEGEILDVNEAFARMHGHTPEDMRGLRITDISAPDSNNLVPERMRRLLAGETLQVELQQVHRDGHTFLTEATGSLVTYGGQPAILSFHRDITERKQVEEKLRKRELQLRESQAAAMIGSWGVDIATDILDWSDETFRRFDKDPATFRTSVEYFVSRIHPEDLAATLCAMQNALERNEPYHVQTRIINETGRQWVMEAFGIVERDREGRPLRFSGTAQDITRRKREEEELLLKRDLMEKVSDSLFIVDPDSRSFLDVNETACAQLGYTKEEMRALQVEDLDPVMLVDQWPAHLEAVMSAPEGVTVETWHQRKDGSTFQVELRVRHVALSDRGYLITSARDITARRKAEEEARQTQAQLQGLFDNAGVAIGLNDPQGRFLAMNSKFVEFLGYGPGEALPLNPMDITHPEDQEATRRNLEEILSGKTASYLYEKRFIRKDGQVVWGLTSVASIRDGLGSVQSLVAVIVDITAQKHAEEQNARLQAQLQQAQKMESLGTLSGGIAHDMNNVLGAILGLASANLELQPQGSPAHRSFETIVKAATRGGEMVRSLLAFARQSQAEDRVLDVNAILREEVKLLERTTLSRVCLEVDLEPDLHPIRGDASALINTFMNLCVNAVDAMPEQGTLTLRTRNLDSEWIEVVVEDTGAGMPGDVLSRAMEPFFTTKGVGKGTGLGLSMVYSTVRAHRGQIEIHSAPGQGTQVQMRFPACERAAEAAGLGAGAPAEAPKGAMAILLVDDDELIQSSMETILRTLGHSVITSSSGEEALTAVEAGFEPDVVILDMNMPGLGGTGTLPRLRALLPSVPILLSTGRTDQAALDLAGAHPLVTLLPKPFAIQDLQQCLAALGR
ncbi:MAG: PAS domain S-box protein [Geothrix sp.]|nr:PAS domain S-box protein [Geothrix sp.]